jgi:predicted nucleic acid-binding protein/GNAT superfamily N-acetyltransferase
MEVRAITSDSKHLSTVKSLWRRNSDTLGYLPGKVFDDAAAKGWLLGAVEDNRCAGYLLFGLSTSHVRITQLCVHEDFRGTGISSALFDALKRSVAGYSTIRLTCRRDFEHASNLWVDLGFIPFGEKPARTPGKTLVVWKNALERSSQLRLFDAVSERGEFKVVIDSNIYIDLERVDELANEEWVAAQALRSDWLDELITLHVTAEIRVDLHRNEDDQVRRRRIQRLVNYPFCNGPIDKREQIELELEPLFPDDMSPQDRSDLRHIAYAVAGDADFFVTRDSGLLSRGSKTSEMYDLEILSPAQLVIRVDEKERSHRYQPVKFEGTPLETRELDASELATAHQDFLDFAQRERKSEFCPKLEKFCADKENFSVQVIVDSATGEHLALWVEDQTDEGHLRVPLLRTASSKFKQTLAIYLAWFILREAVENTVRRISVTEQHLSPDTTAALRRYHFQYDGHCWSKWNLPGLLSIAELVKAPEKLGLEDQTIVSQADDLVRTNNPYEVLQAEQMLWPGKLLGAALPNFIIPIQTTWAMNLFDSKLGEQDMYGSKIGSKLRGENVYYRAARPKVLDGPARVLWYVSQAKNIPQSMAIRACSLITDVRVGPATDIFSEFRRLGVYKWKDVLGLTPATSDGHQDHVGKVMAFRFSHTELFSNPIPWDEVQSILADCTGKSNQLQGPVQISDEVFRRIYRQGVNLP